MATKKNTRWKKNEFYTQDEVIDKVFGEKGTARRDEFEQELEMDMFGGLIKEARKKSNLTQQELAERIGVTKSAISRLENNTSDARLSTIFRALDALQAKIRFSVELFGNKLKIS